MDPTYFKREMELILPCRAMAELWKEKSWILDDLPLENGGLLLNFPPDLSKFIQIHPNSSRFIQIHPNSSRFCLWMRSPWGHAMAIVRPSVIKAETTQAVHQVTIGLVADPILVENTIKTWLYDGYMMAR